MCGLLLSVAFDLPKRKRLTGVCSVAAITEALHVSGRFVLPLEVVCRSGEVHEI